MGWQFDWFIARATLVGMSGFPVNRCCYSGFFAWRPYGGCGDIICRRWFLCLSNTFCWWWYQHLLTAKRRLAAELERLETVHLPLCEHWWGWQFDIHIWIYQWVCRDYGEKRQKSVMDKKIYHFIWLVTKKKTINISIKLIKAYLYYGSGWFCPVAVRLHHSNPSMMKAREKFAGFC